MGRFLFDEEPTKSDEDYGCHSPKNPLAEQLVAIAARLDSLESHLREDIAFLKTHCEPSPNQVEKEALDNNHNDEEERLKLDKEEVSGDNPSDDEDQFQYVVGGQLEVCDGVQLEIEDLAKTQSHVEWLPTNLPFAGPIHMISWTDRKEKWAEPDGWKDSDIVTVRKKGYICSHRMWASPLADKKVHVYWFDINLNSTTFVKACNVRKHTTQIFVKGKISTTIEWFIAWSIIPFRLEDKSVLREGSSDT
ncbi:hypothetical protein E3N88_11689 [Mikania micrantha]|uniref:Uncharacterized protein n=1 Tax=Mikania micrantha TaxID=192012 RepID=A0A5N6P3F6_9ASTR|nr:hypothetical protein E3N88_11689 [Mikania micrantha]